jgi:hypothetical protein
MKKALLTSLVVFSTLVSSFAQFGTCIPDPSFQDSLPGVYPLPFDLATNPNGGIQDSACLNKDYQYNLTAVVGDSLTLGATILLLDSLQILEVNGMPEGFSYACNTPGCKFLKNEIGCAAIYGKAANPADLGQHNLTISAMIWVSGLPNGIPLTFPNPAIAPGNYYLYILEENSPNCVVYTNVSEVNSDFESIRNLPNPFSGITTIEIDSREAGAYQFQVTDMLGRVLHTRGVQINSGLNSIEFDGSNLPDGLYIYSFSNGQSRVARKMLISRG